MCEPRRELPLWAVLLTAALSAAGYWLWTHGPRY